jgi:hypothetical protein
MTDSTKLVLLLLLIVAIFIFGPLLTIWALNTLFPVLAIPYTIKTWFATILVGMFIRGASIEAKGKK